MLLADLAGGLDDPWISGGPVVAATGDQPHAVAIALQPEAVSVVLDLVEPVGAGPETLVDFVGKQNSNDLNIRPR